MAKNDERLAFLADRAMVMLVLLKNRHGDDWNPWFGEAMWEDDDSLAETIRSWPEYETAKKIVRLWIRKHDKRLD